MKSCIVTCQRVEGCNVCTYFNKFYLSLQNEVAAALAEAGLWTLLTFKPVFTRL